MKDLELRLTGLLARKADEVDVDPADGFAAKLSTAASATIGSGSLVEAHDPATIGLEPTPVASGRKRRSTRVAQAILAVACAAAVVAVIAVVTGNDDGATPGDAAGDTPVPGTAEGRLEEPTRQEVALASNAGTYQPSTGPTAVTGARSYASLRRCGSQVPGSAAERCDGSEGWAYVTGSADSAEVHYGLLESADELVLSRLDDRYFVASAPASVAGDGSAAPAAWLIDSVTGRRGALTWQDQPATLGGSQQQLALFPAPHPVPYYTGPGERFLPRVVDRGDLSIRPLSVPDDASAALAIHQPGSGRIWVGTAPDGGDVGLAYTDDGGGSWTHVELPESVRPTTVQLARARGGDDVLVIAATGDRVAVAAAWSSAAVVAAEELFVSDDAGKNWNTVPLDPADGNGRGLSVLSDGRLMVTMYMDLPAIGLLVSNSAVDWSQLEEPNYSEQVSHVRSRVEVYQDGTILHYQLGATDSSDAGMDFPIKFSADLNDWWTIPGLLL